MPLIFLWYMLTTPVDKLRCTLWTQIPPDAPALMQACGFADLHDYRIDAIILTGKGAGGVACMRPGDALATVSEDCGLPMSLDNYELRIIEPDFVEMLCGVAIEHSFQPTRADIKDQCGVDVLLKFDGGYVVPKYVGSREKPPEPPPPICAAPQLAAGIGLYDQATDPRSLRTDEQLSWLAGKLIWFGIVHADCPGGRSGLDPDTLAADGCGMDAARDAVRDWQNQFDAQIYQAAIAYQVPARLIKRIIAVESQYWPMWANANREVGMLQVSQNGADVLLRYDPDLDPDYPKRTADAQYWKRFEVMQLLACSGCGLTGAIESLHVGIPIFARLLAAYRCRAVEINPALSGAEAWQQAAIDYNGSTDYLRKVEQ